MIEAKLVRGLVVERVLDEDPDKLEYSYYDHVSFATDGKVVLHPKSQKEIRKGVPVIELCNYGKHNVYVAYSDEVEELIGVPIRTIMKELVDSRKLVERLIGEHGANSINRNRLEGVITQVRGMGLWGRIKFLFGHRPEWLTSYSCPPPKHSNCRSTIEKSS
jgi:hypothetical protein